MKPSFITPGGLLGSIIIGQSVSFDIFYSDGGLPTTATLQSGDLPASLNFTIFSDRISITGSLTLNEPGPFDFTFRLSNVDGIIERTFRIERTLQDPEWIEPSTIFSLPEFSSISHQFSVIDELGDVQYRKIGGTLPPQLSLSTSGELSGILPAVEENTTFNITIEATTRNDIVIVRTFQYTILESTGFNFPPIWITAGGTIASVINNQPLTFQLQAIDPDDDPLTFIIISGQLPTGLSMSSSGLISGTVDTTLQQTWIFTVQVSDGEFNVNRTFNIATNVASVTAITWITPSNLGSIIEGTQSELKVEAESARGINYFLIDGSLPNGLSLDSNSGGLYGTVNNSDPSYTFTIRADNNTNIVDRTFTLGIISNSDDTFITASIPINLTHFPAWHPETQLQDIFNRAFEFLYRPYDTNFGRRIFPEIVLRHNCQNLSRDEYRDILKDRFPLEFKISGWNVAVARDETGEIVYETIYREIDQRKESDIESLELHGKTYHPTSINVLRNLIPEEGDEILPRWMTSLQDPDDSESALGYVPAIVLMYVKPGFAADIVREMNNNEELTQRLFGINFKINRVLFTNQTESFDAIFHTYDSILEGLRNE